jgi:hypothetical protein
LKNNDEILTKSWVENHLQYLAGISFTGLEMHQPKKKEKILKLRISGWKRKKGQN